MKVKLYIGIAICVAALLYFLKGDMHLSNEKKSVVFCAVDQSKRNTPDHDNLTDVSRNRFNAQNKVENFEMSWDESLNSKESLDEKMNQLSSLMDAMYSMDRHSEVWAKLMQVPSGTLRVYLLASFLSHAKLGVKQACKYSMTLQTSEDKEIAITAIGAMTTSRGLSSEEFAFITSDEFASLPYACYIGSGCGSYIDNGLETSESEKTQMLTLQIAQFNNALTSAISSKQQDFIIATKMAFLARIADLIPEIALTEFKSLGGSIFNNPEEQVWSAVESLVSCRGTKTIDYLLREDASGYYLSRGLRYLASNDLDQANVWLDQNVEKFSPTQYNHVASAMADVATKLGDQDGAKKWMHSVKDQKLTK